MFDERNAGNDTRVFPGTGTAVADAVRRHWSSCRATAPVSRKAVTSSSRKNGTPSVTVHGPPAEVALFVYGRKPQALVNLIGTDEDIALLSDTSLGI